MQKPQWNRIKDFVQRKELSLAMGLHLGAIFLCGLIYILLPEDVHLRWGLTYVLTWIIFLSAYSIKSIGFKIFLTKILALFV